MCLCVCGKALAMAVARLETLAGCETSRADGVDDRTLSAPGRQRNGHAGMETCLLCVCVCVHLDCMWTRLDPEK